MSKSSLSNLTDPKRVAEAAKDRKSREHAMLCGALGAIEKGGQAVGGDESTMQKAAHYGRVLSGVEKQELGEKHYGEIADMVKSFVQGPQEVPKHRRSSMGPLELAKNLRHIAASIENSKNPSKELVLKDIRKIINKIATASADVQAKLDMARDALERMPREYVMGGFNDIDVIVEFCKDAKDTDMPNSCITEPHYIEICESYPGWTVGDFREYRAGLKTLMRSRAVVGGQVSVLNNPVDIGPTELGPSCTVTLTRCDFLGEKTASNVVGTIDCGDGEMMEVSIRSLDRSGSRQTFNPPEAAQRFDPDEFNSFRPIDAFSMAINKIAEQAGYYDFDILTVENGLITHGLSTRPGR